MVITLVTVAVVAIPLTFHTRTTLEDLRLRRAVIDAVSAWDNEVRIVELDADAYDNRASVELLIVGRGNRGRRGNSRKRSRTVSTPPSTCACSTNAISCTP